MRTRAAKRLQARSALVVDLRVRLRRGLQLTRGERLALHRRAKRMTQVEMADIYGVGLDLFRTWECDVPDVQDDIPLLQVCRTELPLRELLFVHRRRRGITLEEISEALGRCVSWVHQAESGRAGAEQVVDYVLNQGERR